MPELPDPDETLIKMRDDDESDWPYRLARDIADSILVQENHISHATNRHSHQLSPSEQRILLCLSVGLNNRMAADVLGVSEDTIRSQVASARAKLGAKNQAHAVALAIRSGQIT
jgi:DNA-binding CsgD family transcriptional regulator